MRNALAEISADDKEFLPSLAKVGNRMDETGDRVCNRTTHNGSRRLGAPCHPYTRLGGSRKKTTYCRPGDRGGTARCAGEQSGGAEFAPVKGSKGDGRYGFEYFRARIGKAMAERRTRMKRSTRDSLLYRPGFGMQPSLRRKG